MFLADIKRQGPASGRFNFYAVGDLHADAIGFNEDRLKAYIAAIVADPLAVAVCVGDYLHGRIPGMKHFDMDDVRPDFRDHMKDYVNFGLDVVSDYLLPLVHANVPVVLVQGNHDDYLDQVCFTAMLAQRLGPRAKYLGGEGLIRVRSGKARPSKPDSVRYYTTVIHASHGFGGGRRPGSKINNQQQALEWLDGVQVVVSGHVHDGAVRVLPGVGVQTTGEHLHVTQRDRALYRAPAFVERVVEGTVTYAGRHGYGTNDRGLQFLKVNPEEGRIYRAECEF